MPALALVDTPVDAFPGTFIPASPISTTPVDGSCHWSTSLSAKLYRIDGWGAPYFTANSSGNISVRPHGSNTLPHQDIDLMQVVKEVTDPKSSGGLGLQLPLIVRFPDVLKNRLVCLQSAFNFAIKAQRYESHYQGVYPVKCNQDRFIVEDIVEFGLKSRFGLEAGSKPEILLAMSCLCKGNRDAFLVCNGFKDAEYISLALLGKKLELNTVIVLEQEEELDLVINLSKKMNVRPVIGLRAKLRTKHSGHFGSTSGEKGKFGLTAIQIVRVVRKLGQVGMLDCLELLHFHIGSQIPSTALLSDGVTEAAQLYCELIRLGASKMKVIDIGGGLGIDYDGSKSGESDLSVAYSLEQYATAVVESVRLVCDQKSVKHPVICSESGRAIVSHHSVLILEAVSASQQHETPSDIEFLLESYSEEAQGDYENLYLAAKRVDHESCLLYVDQLKQRCVQEFKEGSLSIDQLAGVDGLCGWVVKAIGASDPVLTYNVNLSVFTSIPDFWGIDQLFPIVPIHRLEQRPVARGILSDLTCDSDGKIDKFIGGESSLPLHEMDNDGGCSEGRYYLGMFLGGAYEEALGGVHNLFGGPSVVRVLQSDGPLGFEVTRAVMGQSSADVLRAVQHEPELMIQTLKDRAEKAGGYEENGELVASCLDRSFNNMPYLSMETSANALTAAVSNLGVYYRDEAAAGGGKDGNGLISVD